MAAKWELYKDEGGNHRWRLKAAKGRLVASSGEAFRRSRPPRWASSQRRQRRSRRKSMI